ncbi:unnamed protein product [Amoebophrya sp. A120]|nr:unnamed protein product [Amoebophrya sp. A120]|eukprot:GSA120T00004920001.1
MTHTQEFSMKNCRRRLEQTNSRRQRTFRRYYSSFCCSFHHSIPSCASVSRYRRNKIMPGWGVRKQNQKVRAPLSARQRQAAPVNNAKPSNNAWQPVTPYDVAAVSQDMGYVTLYHATSPQNAAQIVQSQWLKPGNGGELGPGAYFCADPDNARFRQRAVPGKGYAVVLSARVKVGATACITSGKVVDAEFLRSFGYGSAKVYEKDIYMIPGWGSWQKITNIMYHTG